MEDRELLELAAKAGGHEFPRTVLTGESSYVGREWNPIADDGDALRLALNLGVFDGPASFAKFYSWLSDAMTVEDDEAKAFRLAITYYAAEIGSAMP